jgi:replication factor C subunit 3/5
MALCLYTSLYTRFRRPDLSSNITIAKPDWETYCEKVAEMIVQKQTPEQIHAVRGKLYELLAHCIPPTTILKVCQTEPQTIDCS